MKANRIYAAVLLGLAIFTAGFTAGALLGNSTRRGLVHKKWSGALPHRSWMEIIRYLIPQRYQLPGPLGHLPSIHIEQRQEGVCPVQWQTPFGPFWGRSRDGELLSLLMWEQFIDNIYQQGPVVVREGDVVLDAGANLGTFTRAALQGGARRVISFEPEPTNIACFKKSFAEEIRSGRVVLVESALWNNSGTLSFVLPAENNSGTGAVVANSPSSAISVQATTIDETVARLRLPRVDFIKMDIEGSERFAIAGGKETIQRFVPRMALSVEHLPDDEETIPEAVSEANAGYHLIRSEWVYFFYK